MAKQRAGFFGRISGLFSKAGKEIIENVPMTYSPELAMPSGVPQKSPTKSYRTKAQRKVKNKMQRASRRANRK